MTNLPELLGQFVKQNMTYCTKAAENAMEQHYKS